MSLLIFRTDVNVNLILAFTRSQIQLVCLLACYQGPFDLKNRWQEILSQSQLQKVLAFLRSSEPK